MIRKKVKFSIFRHSRAGGNLERLLERDALISPSFPRRRESSCFSMFWIGVSLGRLPPACAGMTVLGTFYEPIKSVQNSF